MASGPLTISLLTNLGTVLDEDITIDNKLTTFKRPLGSTDNTTVFNLFGKQRDIILQGFHDGTDYVGVDTDAKIAAFIAEVENWININVQTSATYTDSFGASYTVLASSFRWTRTAPGNRIIYTLRLIEGSAIAAFSP